MGAEEFADPTRDAHGSDALGQFARCQTTQASQGVHHGLLAAHELRSASIRAEFAVTAEPGHHHRAQETQHQVQHKSGHHVTNAGATAAVVTLAAGWLSPDRALALAERTGPVLLPLLTTVAVRARGVDYRFHRPLDMARAEAHIDGLRYRFACKSDLGAVEAEVSAEPADTVGLYYANPTGPLTYCLNSKLATVRMSFEAAGRAKVVHTSKIAALEIGTLEADPSVRMLA